MLVAALLGSLGRPGDGVDEPLQAHPVDVGHHGRTGPYIGDVAVGQEDDLLGVRDQCRGVRGEEALALAEADDQRHVEPGADQAVGLVLVHHDQRVRTFQAVERRPHRVGQIALVGVLDEMGDDLRICFRRENVPARRKLVAQCAEVLDDAVVDDGDAPGAVAVGMGVEVADASVGGPAGVAQANAGGGRLAAEGVLEHRDLTRTLLHEQLARVGDEGDARRVVTAVLETPKPIEEDGACFPGPGISDDPTHRWLLSRSRGPCPPAFPNAGTGGLRRGLV